jgi:adenosine deaminase
MNFRQLPKVELHLHLDCSLSYDVVSRLAPGVTVKEYREEFIAPSKCTNLADFLTRALQGIRLMQTEHQLRSVTRDLFDQLEHDGVMYAEVRFAPLQHTDLGLSPEWVVDIVEQETAKAIAETGVEARLILCTLRHFNESQSLATVRLVEEFRGSMVAGFDIAADEAGYPIDGHIPAFRFAQDHRIPCTAHAGEARGADSVWETLEYFRPTRLGHGVRSMEDMKLIAHLRDKAIHLEVCPTCNVQTDIYDGYEDHPIHKLYEMGLSIGVNTDGRTISNVSLSEEYQKLHCAFGWGAEHFLTCNKNALRASFLPENHKKRLMDRLTGEYKQWRSVAGGP